MREILAAVVVSALFAAACDAGTNAPAPSAAKAASPAPAEAAPAPATPPAASSTHDKKASAPVKVAKARHVRKATAPAGKKAGGTAAAPDPSAPPVKLSQSPPSSY